MEVIKNTTQKGDLFENSVYDFLKKKINNHEIPIFPPSHTKIIKKPKYYSRKRERKITFDLSIELYIDINASPISICIIECKNYNNSVPVNDIEEFSTKLSQVAEHNSKGVVITSKGFQEGSITYAKNTGMGLWIFNEADIQYVLHRNSNYQRTTNIENIFNVDMFDQFDKNERVFQSYFYSNHICYADFSHFIASLFPNIPYQKPNKKAFQYTKNSKIEEITDSILAKIFYEHNAVDLFKICEVYKINYEVKNCLPNQDILGNIIFSPLKITIFDEGTYRSRFTLAHELGHFFLKHDRFLKSEYVTNRNLQDIDEKYHDIIFSLEREANYFASTLLLPKAHIGYEFYEALKKYQIRKPTHLYVDNQPHNLMYANLILNELSKKFHVSKQAISIRLQKLNLLIDERFTKINFY